MLYLILFDLAAILIIALAALGAAEYVPDAALVVLMPLMVRPPYAVSCLAWLLLIVVAATVRRWPPVARRLSPWPMPAWVLPGAVEMVDSEEVIEPRYQVKLMSSAKRVAREEKTHELLTQSIRRKQRTLLRYARTPTVPEPVRTPPPLVTIPIDGEDAKLAALLYGRGKTPAQVARLLTGYSGDRHAEFVAKAEALRNALGHDDGPLDTLESITKGAQR